MQILQSQLHGFALQLFGVAGIDIGVRALLGRKRVEIVGAIQLALKLRDVPEVVQGKRIGRIVEVGLEKERRSLLVLLFFHSFNAFAIQALNGGELAAAGNRNSQDIATPGEGERTCAKRKGNNGFKRRFRH